ncbi:MAG: SAM-dependent methyltransferase [Armatimonadetes bacterium CG_4_10_14_3_um_filter_66_18]|nr:class I SAM-dependent methyltransferase [Armatimonadota bacterium]OIO92807.1 MAG: hypothetical protein AUJ96_31610 [Armatimonadetes bacterium CG2_30_66_41]PIU90381.1 MAG: SAM-dependent methyltransferase [Armatimonadetes bacterium CG06_land_8_20_14_3_00_66_21]PIX43002.1 MAG: SAM-dependent methyltransferase [Armatimonadetes bacterium CG_4_8_14_3_um_filter_66_20]PIY50673.1 MAG: SAM-dependent methyltransferase [Armatimonadetes bacterium CG_4_10_14_3_um_filter_66_18]PIZ47362.1 MAG: SAM-dependent
MHDRQFPHEQFAKLIGPERWEKWNPPQFLARLETAVGSVVLDLGCGPGFWTLPLAEIVGETGAVHALDTSPEMLAALAQRQPPPQVKPLPGEATEIPLADESVDLVWAAFVLHEAEPPVRCLAEVWRILRPGGRVAVLDWRPDAEGDEGPPRHHRVSVSQVEGWSSEVGFSVVQRTWQDEHSYLVEAQR